MAAGKRGKKAAAKSRGLEPKDMHRMAHSLGQLEARAEHEFAMSSKSRRS